MNAHAGNRSYYNLLFNILSKIGENKDPKIFLEGVFFCGDIAYTVGDYD